MVKVSDKKEAKYFQECKTPLKFQNITKQRQKRLEILDAAPNLMTLRQFA